MLIDMHNHTRHGSSDSVIEIDELLHTAKQRGMDGVCVTEHENIVKDFDFEALRKRYEMPIFVGVEISILPVGHFLCYGIDSISISVEEVRVALQQFLEDLPSDSTTIESEELMKLKGAVQLVRALKHDDALSLIETVHIQKGAIFWAHPFDDYTLLRKRFNEYVEECGLLQVEGFDEYLRGKDDILWQTVEKIDGFEVINGCSNERGVFNYLTSEFATLLLKGRIGGSDAHHQDGIGIAGTKFDRSIENEADFISALKSGKMEPCLSEYGVEVTAFG